MSPDERDLLESTLKLAKENNRMLRDIKRSLFWSRLWGVLKVLIIVVPFIIGYLYLEPHFGSLSDSFKQVEEMYKGL
jgi:hypothetical protein